MRINRRKLKNTALKVGNYPAVRTTLLTSALGLMLIGGTIFGYYEGRLDRNLFSADDREQLNRLQAQDQVITDSLKIISAAHKAEWDAHTQAMAHALLITDAFQDGGMEKAGLLYDETERYINLASDQKQIIKAELEKYGIVVPDDTNSQDI